MNEDTPVVYHAMLSPGQIYRQSRRRIEFGYWSVAFFNNTVGKPFKQAALPLQLPVCTHSTSSKVNSSIHESVLEADSMWHQHP